MYKSVLVAVDLPFDCGRALSVAKSFADRCESGVHIVHVVDPISAGHNLDMYADNFRELEQRAVELARCRLLELAKTELIPESNVHVRVGATAPTIRTLADELSCDAIVIGSHGRSGWKTLLGSTASKLLHGATCDVVTLSSEPAPSEKQTSL